MFDKLYFIFNLHTEEIQPKESVYLPTGFDEQIL